jgi:hypothetical protein
VSWLFNFRADYEKLFFFAALVCDKITSKNLNILGNKFSAAVVISIKVLRNGDILSDTFFHTQNQFPVFWFHVLNWVQILIASALNID